MLSAEYTREVNGVKYVQVNGQYVPVDDLRKNDPAKKSNHSR
jgi:hypothetical protein